MEDCVDFSTFIEYLIRLWRNKGISKHSTQRRDTRRELTNQTLCLRNCDLVEPDLREILL
jgi:hypothetical protein